MQIMFTDVAQVIDMFLGDIDQKTQNREQLKDSY